MPEDEANRRWAALERTERALEHVKAGNATVKA